MDQRTDDRSFRGMLDTVRRIAGELAPALATTAVMAVPLFVLAFALFLTVVVSAIAFLQSDNAALNEIGRRLSELTLSEVLAFVTSLVRDYPVVAIGAGALSILSVGFATIRAVVAQVMTRFDDADTDLRGRILALERRIARQNELLERLTEAPLVAIGDPASTPIAPSPSPSSTSAPVPAPPAPVEGYTPRDAATQALDLMARTIELQATIIEHRALPPWDGRSLTAIRLAMLAPPPAFSSAQARQERVTAVSDDAPKKRAGLFSRNLFKDGLFDKSSTKSPQAEALTIYSPGQRGVAERNDVIDRINAINRLIAAHTGSPDAGDLPALKIRGRIERLAKAVDDDLRLLQDTLYRIVATHGEDLLPRLQELRARLSIRMTPQALRD
jgi:hypothetical protein